MKDIVANRKRVSFGRKLRVAGIALRENGIVWCAFFGSYYVSSTLAHIAFRKMDQLRKQRNIPGLNSLALNKEIWDAWDWGKAGDEWTLSEEWKQSLMRCVIEPFVGHKQDILEIGPGAGRWTGVLLEHARSLVGVDISPACVEQCQRRFGTDSRARFLLGSGNDLAGVPERSIDRIWSFDVFVHINQVEVERYMEEFRRVLKPEGSAAIHHGSVGGASGGWRSNLTAQAFEQILRRCGFRIDRSFAHWTDGNEIHRLPYDDLVTVFSLAR